MNGRAHRAVGLENAEDSLQELKTPLNLELRDGLVSWHISWQKGLLN